MNSPWFNRIALGLAFPAITAGAWNTVDLVAPDKSPPPLREAVALPDGESPIPSAKTISASERPNSEVDLATQFWNNQGQNAWENIENLSANVRPPVTPQPASWINDLLDGEPYKLVATLRNSLSISNDVKQQYDELTKLSSRIDKLLSGFDETCEKYSADIKSVTSNLKGISDSIEAEVKKLPAPKQMAAVPKVQPKLRSTPSYTTPKTGTTSGAGKLLGPK